LDADIVVCENRGRDVLPFLQVAGRLYDEGVRIVLKLHTKRSTHRQDGETWRRELVEKLLAPERATSILAAFRQRPELGLVASEGHLQPLSYYWGANQANVEYLCRRTGIPTPDPGHDRFIAGTMFWARLDAMLPLLDSHLGTWEFEDEAGQVDGTLAHAVERVFCLTARYQHLIVEEGSATCGLPRDVGASAPYPYARRSDLGQ
jgi:lipopolysaccharide biosynthesis protein